MTKREWIRRAQALGANMTRDQLQRWPVDSIIALVRALEAAG